MKKRNWLTFLALLVIIVAGLAVYAVSGNPSHVSYAKTGTATLEIKTGHKTVKARVPLSKQETAIKQLTSYTSAHHIQITITGSGKMAYVKSLYGCKAGAKKGWMFTVNGKMPKVGAGAVIVKPKQKVVWTYSKF